MPQKNLRKFVRKTAAPLASQPITSCHVQGRDCYVTHDVTHTKTKIISIMPRPFCCRSFCGGGAASFCECAEVSALLHVFAAFSLFCFTCVEPWGNKTDWRHTLSSFELRSTPTSTPSTTCGRLLHTHTNQLWIGQSIGYTYLLGRITYLHAHSWARRHTNCSLDDVIVGIIVQLWPAAGTSVAKQHLHDPDSTNTNVLDGARRGGLEVTPTVF